MATYISYSSYDDNFKKLDRYSNPEYSGKVSIASITRDPPKAENLLRASTVLTVHYRYKTENSNHDFKINVREDQSNCGWLEVGSLYCILNKFGLGQEKSIGAATFVLRNIMAVYGDAPGYGVATCSVYQKDAAALMKHGWKPFLMVPSARNHTYYKMVYLYLTTLKEGSLKTLGK